MNVDMSVWRYWAQPGHQEEVLERCRKSDRWWLKASVIIAAFVVFVTVGFIFYSFPMESDVGALASLCALMSLLILSMLMIPACSVVESLEWQKIKKAHPDQLPWASFEDFKTSMKRLEPLEDKEVLECLGLVHEQGWDAQEEFKQVQDIKNVLGYWPQLLCDVKNWSIKKESSDIKKAILAFEGLLEEKNVDEQASSRVVCSVGRLAVPSKSIGDL